jgi:hypothetical protein
MPTPIIIVITGHKHIASNTRGALTNPFDAVECDGLPPSESGKPITSFSLFSSDQLRPESFEIGHSYKITGNVNGQYYRVNTIVEEVMDPVPGEAGVPRPEPRRYDGGGTQRQTALKEAASLFAQGINKIEDVDLVLLLADRLDGWLRELPKERQT